MNVMAYVEAPPQRLKNRANGRDCRRDLDMQIQRVEVAPVRVQAVMLWSAGAIKLAEYETALASRMEAEGNI